MNETVTHVRKVTGAEIREAVKVPQKAKMLAQSSPIGGGLGEPLYFETGLHVGCTLKFEWEETGVAPTDDPVSPPVAVPITVQAYDRSVPRTQPGNIVFSVGGKKVLRFEPDGSTYVHERRCEGNDPEILELVRKCVQRRTVDSDGKPTFEVMDAESENVFLKEQIDQLAKVILRECPEAIRGEGACDTAAALLDGLHRQKFDKNQKIRARHPDTPVTGALVEKLEAIEEVTRHSEENFPMFDVTDSRWSHAYIHVVELRVKFTRAMNELYAMRKRLAEVSDLLQSALVRQGYL